MKKTHVCCTPCSKYRKFKNTKISYIFEKTLLFSIICSKFGSKDEKVFKEEESIEILKSLDLINDIEKYQNNMSEENISQEFRLGEIDEKRNYFTEEIKQNELVSKKHIKICNILSYTEHLIILASTVTGYVSISAFVSLAYIPVCRYSKFCNNNKILRNNCRK